MVVNYQVTMRTELEGLEAIRPRLGWDAVDSYWIRLKCWNCSAVIEWTEITLGRLVPGRAKRRATRTLRCEGCGRKGEVFVNEFSGEVIGDRTILMRMQADGLQPEDGFIRLGVPCCAIDINGNASEEFDFDIQGNNNWINLRFGTLSASARTIHVLTITFERI